MIYMYSIFANMTNYPPVVASAQQATNSKLSVYMRDSEEAYLRLPFPNESHRNHYSAHLLYMYELRATYMTA
jgi:hypothetical protein